jgi:hypothetical protein
MLTTFFARLLGLWIVLAVLSMIGNRQATLAALSAVFADPGLIFVTGVFTLVIGIAVVVSHNRWSGGALPIIVTCYGWVALLKGLLFLCMPVAAQTALYIMLHFERFFYEYLAISLVLGAYLTYGGFKRSARSGTLAGG